MPVVCLRRVGSILKGSWRSLDPAHNFMAVGAAERGMYFLVALSLIAVLYPELALLGSSAFRWHCALQPGPCWPPA